MNGLISLQHIKYYYTGETENWVFLEGKCLFALRNPWEPGIEPQSQDALRRKEDNKGAQTGGFGPDSNAHLNSEHRLAPP